MRHFFLAFLFVSALINQNEASIVLTGICYAGCAAVVTTCYATAGLVFGTITAGKGSKNNFLS